MKIGISIAIVILTILLTGVVMADKQPGAVMAVDQNGVDNKLYPTTEIYIKGVNLENNTAFKWDIFDMAVTCPPETTQPEIGCAKLLYHGSGGMTAGDGSISPYQDSGWAIPNGDYAKHPYKLLVTIGPTNQNQHPVPALFYTKIDSFEPIPELPVVGLTAIGLFGLLLLRKKYA